MSKVEDALLKDGWEITPCHQLKPGDYVTVMTGSPIESEGTVSQIIENDNGTISIFYGERGVKMLPSDTGQLWRAPKEYEHLEVRWGTGGTKYINISTDPRKPLFCLASLIEIGLISAPNNQVEIIDSCRSPEILLEEKP